jgi:5-methylcytosine-specific restriction protein B
MNHLTTVLNRHNGPPHRYWRIGTRDDSESHWPVMRDSGIVAIGWPKLGDLSQALTGDGFKEVVRNRLAETYPASPQVAGRTAQQITNFCKAIDERDYVLACDGAKVLAIGRVVGPYSFGEGRAFPHGRPVEWLNVGEWQLPTLEGLQTTVHEYRTNTDNLIAIESRLLDAPLSEAKPSSLESVPRSDSSTPSPMQWTSGGIVGRL